MINRRTKDKGMIYTKNSIDYTIDHQCFKVIEFVEIEGENKYKIHIQNQMYDTIITPYIDTKEELKEGCNIRIAMVLENGNVICHGYEVIDEHISELSPDNLPPHKSLLLEDTPVDVAKYKDILFKYIRAIKSDEIREFVINILSKVCDKFYKWPAATNVHHNIKSGLLQHTVNVVKNAFNLSVNYTDIDQDILLAGAILHDIGKVYEYSEDGNISGEGRLFDHINIGTRMIFEEFYHGKDEIYHFSERDLYHIAHIILSHHGKLEWGSPRTPATKEAYIVHYADYIDTNMYIIHRDLRNTDIDQSIKSRYAGQLVNMKFAQTDQYDKN